jgi:Fur family peroxide stress response transcriptional regulator
MHRAALAERLREKGLRVTQQRIAVLEYLCSTPTHPTAEQIGTAVNRAQPTTSRASVYNVLHSLKERGLIEELVFDDAVARYDANLGPHHHFVCTRCGSVHDVPFDAVPAPLKRRLSTGHTVESVEITLRGTCPGCAKP